MGGVHASLHHVAIAVVLVGIVVSIVVIVVVRVVAAEAESKAVPEVAVVPAIMVESATRFAATETTIVERHAAAECGAAVATMEAATTHRHAAAVATPTSATARQRHGWRSQTDRRNCQQRDHCLTQHCHSPSEISLPASTRITGGDRSGEALRLRHHRYSTLRERLN